MGACDTVFMGRTRREETPAAVLPVPVDPLDEFAKGILSIESQIEDQFPEELCKVLKKIAYEISVVGLSESEACMISNYSHELFIALKLKYPIVQRLIEVKDLEYKRNLLRSISARAGNDDKVAMWLLEAKYPHEFNRKKGTGGGGDENPEDLIGMAIEFVRKSGDSNGLVSEESGRAFVIKTKEKSGQLQNINDVLG